MGKFKFILFFTLLMFFAACSDDEPIKTNEEQVEETIESYPPIGAYLEKTEYKKGENMWLSIYPQTDKELPKQYGYINNVEYFINEKSIGKSNMPPYYLFLYNPNLTLGKHEISIKISLNKENVVWETTVKSFTIIE